MSNENKPLGIFAVDSSNSITITHNLNQRFVDFILFVDGEPRKDLVLSAIPSSGTQSVNEFTITFTSTITGFVELIETQNISVGQFSSEIYNSTIQDIENLKPNILYRYNGTTPTNIVDGTTIDANDLNSTTCPFEINLINDSAYSYDNINHIITFQSSGVYRVFTNLSIGNISGGRETSRVFVLHNGSQVNGGIGFGYHRNVANGEDTITTNSILNITTSDTLEVRAQCFTSGTLEYVENSCSLYVEKIRV